MKTLVLFIFCSMAILLSNNVLAQNTSSTKKIKTPKDRGKQTTKTTPQTGGKSAAIPTNFDTRPPLGPVPNFEFPRFTEHRLSNGLKVIVIEDHQQPTISFRLQIRAGESLDGDKVGISFMMTNLLPKGTAKRSAERIATQIDSVGASISSNSAGELATLSASGLKKHMPLMLDIFSDVILNPTFPDEELKNLLPQVEASIKQEKSRPMELASALSRMVVYGANHPSARRRTIDGVKSITVEDIRAFHDKYFRPNNGASLAIVGDVTHNEIIPLLEKVLSRWKPNSSLNIAAMPPTQPMPQGVYFIQRPGSVQSTVISTGPMPARKDPDYEPLSLAISVLGNGFSGRLFKTLRETYSFTYTPFAGLTQGKFYNRYFAGAEVRSAVTDSAIMVLNREVSRISKDVVPEEEFAIIRTSDVSQYLMAFEKSDFLASLLQNADYLEIDPSVVRSRASRLSNISNYAALEAATKYLRSDKLSLVVVGSPEIEPILAKYGTVYSYNLDLQKIGENNGMEKSSLSPQELLDKYTTALGGSPTLASVQTVITSMTMNINAGGQSFTGTGISKQKVPMKYYRKISFPVMQQEEWVNDKKAWRRMMGTNVEEVTSAPELAESMEDATMFSVTKLATMGYTLAVKGKKNGKIVMSAKKGTNETTYFFDATTYLLSSSEKTVETQQGPVPVTSSYDSYIDVNGIKFPKITKVDMGGMYVVTSENAYQINTTIDDAEFVAPK